MPTIAKSKLISAKRRVTKLSKELPDDCTYEDIQYHLYVLQKIDRGLKESKIGKGYSTDEVKTKLKKWLKK